MNYYVYVLGSEKKPKTTYVGWTNNLKNRLLKHNLGKGAKFTRGRKWKIIYKKSYNTKSEAMKNEYYLKISRKKRNKLKDKFKIKYKFS